MTAAVFQIMADRRMQPQPLQFGPDGRQVIGMGYRKYIALGRRLVRITQDACVGGAAVERFTRRVQQDKAVRAVFDQRAKAAFTMLERLFSDLALCNGPAEPVLTANGED